jgi:glyoxylase-like metal-dependent hydrolase (beta-lactamase superfamily II)
MDASKRSFLKGGAMIGALSAVTLGGGMTSGRTTAGAPGLPQLNPGWHGFSFGEIRAAVLSDGPLDQGDPVKTLLGRSEAEIRDTMRENFLDQHAMTLDQNVLLMQTGSRLVLFDTGTGGAPLFGPKPGRLMENVANIGIDPAAITDVVLTHAHPDHLWGLTGEDGAEHFPNAQVHVHEADHKFFTDPANDAHPLLGAFMPACRKELETVAKRLNVVRDGQEILPGVTAMLAPGHTPGHTAYRIDSGSKSLLVVGDLAHHHAVFTRYPDIRFGFDTDPQQMVETRRSLFAMIAAERMTMLAYHFPFPGLGNLARDGDAYRWVPAGLDNAF